MMTIYQRGRRCAFWAFVGCLCAFQSAAVADFVGTVTRVQAANELIVKHDGVTETIRLFGVTLPLAPPELPIRALALTKRLCMKKDVTVHIIRSIQYGTASGVVILPDQRRLDLVLLSEGFLCWDPLAAPDDMLLRGRERGARQARKGIWAIDSASRKPPEPPVEKTGVDRLLAPVPGESEQVYLVTLNRHYHRPRCPYLNTPGVSCTLAEAVKRGYSACPVCGSYRVPQTLKNTAWMPPATLPHRPSVESPLPLPRLGVTPPSPKPSLRKLD